MATYQAKFEITVFVDAENYKKAQLRKATDAVVTLAASHIRELVAFELNHEPTTDYLPADVSIQVMKKNKR